MGAYMNITNHRPKIPECVDTRKRRTWRKVGQGIIQPNRRICSIITPHTQKGTVSAIRSPTSKPLHEITVRRSPAGRLGAAIILIDHMNIWTTSITRAILATEGITMPPIALIAERYHITHIAKPGKNDSYVLTDVKGKGVQDLHSLRHSSYGISTSTASQHSASFTRSHTLAFSAHNHMIIEFLMLNYNQIQSA